MGTAITRTVCIVIWRRIRKLLIVVVDMSKSSNTGGRSAKGSGARPVYGGYYGGGSAVPYTSCLDSTQGLASAGSLNVNTAHSLFPGVWSNDVCHYPWSHPLSFDNATTQQTETKPVLCLCQRYTVCGCDENRNLTYVTAVLGNSDFNKLNRSLVYVNEVNGTSAILINGTLANGTTAPRDGNNATHIGSMAPVSFHPNMITLLLAAVVGAVV